MYSFQFDFTSDIWILFGCALFLMIPMAWLFLMPAVRVSRTIKKTTRNDEYDAASQQPVSVIVFSGDDAEGLRHLLPAILGQDYRAPFEVIVVNEGSSDATAEVVGRLRQIHDNLYLTYTPDGARQLSRKKLALMIGIKAARFPIVVHTTSSARIESDQWLGRMTAPFSNDSTEVVIGACAPESSLDKGFGRRYRCFNDAADTVIWLNAALTGHPYRGTENNIAYTRDAFFRNRGFSKSLNLKSGDDDIFVNEISNSGNTAVVLHPDAIVSRKAFNVPRAYRERRSRYIFTGRHIPRTPRYIFAFGIVLLWCVIALSVLAAVLCWPNLAGVAIAAFICLTAIVTASCIWRRTLKLLSRKSLLFSLPYVMLTRPFANAVAFLKSIRGKKYNYTWN